MASDWRFRILFTERALVGIRVACPGSILVVGCNRALFSAFVYVGLEEGVEARV